MKIMKAIGVTLVILAVLCIAGWRWYLSSPSWGEWESMETVTKTEVWPAVSQCYVSRSGMSMGVDDQVISESHWIDCTFWNGNGIDSVQIYAIVGKDSVLVYPGQEELTVMTGGPIDNSDIIGFAAFVDSPEFEPGNQRCDVSLNAKLTDLLIIVYDSRGNIAKKRIYVPPDIDLKNTA
ncbi:MAG: hypothetical protein V1668_00855 [Patescibacteria group bacterium]